MSKLDTANAALFATYFVGKDAPISEIKKFAEDWFAVTFEDRVVEATFKVAKDTIKQRGDGYTKAERTKQQLAGFLTDDVRLNAVREFLLDLKPSALATLVGLKLHVTVEAGPKGTQASVELVPLEGEAK